MNQLSKIVLASSNAGKIQEFKSIFAPLHIEIIPQDDLNIPEIEETGTTFIENALLKAKNASQHANLPAISDDSGIMVSSLDGAPGIYSKRYSGKDATDQKNNLKLINALKNHENKTGHYVCIMAFCFSAKHPLPLLGQGFCQGRIIDSPRGENGFGYDPIFYLDHLQKTVAELTPAEKNKISHRAIATKDLMQQINKHNSF